VLQVIQPGDGTRTDPDPVQPGGEPGRDVHRQPGNPVDHGHDLGQGSAVIRVPLAAQHLLEDAAVTATVTGDGVGVRRVREAPRRTLVSHPARARSQQ
jgi:hypothetical protein